MTCPQSNTQAYKLSTVGETRTYSFPPEFIHYDLVPSQASSSIVLAKKNSLLCLLQRPIFFKTYGKNYTRFKLYHLSSKHKIICNRTFFSSEAPLVLYLPMVCFRLGSLLTGAGRGSGNSTKKESCNLHIRDEEQCSSSCMYMLLDAKIACEQAIDVEGHRRKRNA